MDWEFEKEQDIQEEFENFLEYLELREWQKYGWDENSIFLLSIEEHKFYSNIDEIDYLKRSTNGWLFLNGYHTNPLRVKRSKYQKLKKIKKWK